MNFSKKRIKLHYIEPNARMSGWLDPFGYFWPVIDETHHDFAEWWFESQFGNVPNYPVDAIQKIGWVHVTAGFINFNYPPTRRQVDILYDWMIATGQEYYDPAKNKNLSAQQFIERFAL